MKKYLLFITLIISFASSAKSQTVKKSHNRYEVGIVFGYQNNVRETYGAVAKYYIGKKNSFDVRYEFYPDRYRQIGIGYKYDFIDVKRFRVQTGIETAFCSRTFFQNVRAFDYVEILMPLHIGFKFTESIILDAGITIARRLFFENRSSFMPDWNSVIRCQLQYQF